MALLAKSIGLYINILSYVAPKKAFTLAYKLFSNPRAGKLKAEDLPQILQTAHKETIQENEHSIQTYLWKGNDTVILLAHGWESNTARWEKLLNHLLQTGNTIVALDAPAHGLSSGKEFNVPIYASFIHSIVKKHHPKYIIGHSMGGIAAIYYQHLYPNHPLEKMVLLGAPSDFSIILDNYLNLLSLNNKIKNAFHDYISERFQITISEFSGKKFIQNSKLQGFIAHDLHDKIVLYAEAEKLASSWNQVTFVSTTGLGHSLHDADLNQKIVAFLLEA
jgi:pimeloyl-ACP methyl ester carboxylesterase